MTGAISAGNVYVFNIPSQDLDLSVNGAPIPSGTIQGWSFSNPKYQPTAAAVPRTLNASDGRGKFFNGKNALSMQWLDGLFFTQIRLDGNLLPLNQDVILCIQKNRWQLVNQYAIEIASGDVIPASMLT